MNDFFRKAKDFVLRAIAYRKTLTIEKHPSIYWTDFAANFRYVYDLSPDELFRIRYHTYHLTSDSYQTYYFANESFKKIMVDGYRFLTESGALNPVDEGENGIGVKTEYGCISHDLLRYISAICDIKEAMLLDHTQVKTVIEIGGGYGGLARTHLVQNPDVRYIICDLEETLFFSAIYLSIQLGSDKVHLIDKELENSRLEGGHVYIVPQSRIEFIKNLHADYAVSQQSLQEMTVPQVELYLEWLATHADHLYSCNIIDHGSLAREKNIVVDLPILLRNAFLHPIWIGSDPDEHNRYGDNHLARAVYRCRKM
jgi:hypothetical protein